MLRLAKDVGPRLRLGHPWVYRNALARPPALPAGAVVEVADRKGTFVGRGYFDPGSPIAVRVLTRDAAEPVDTALVERRLGEAVALRAMLASRIDSDGVRLCHGEADALPGLVIDRYADVAVVQTDGPAAAACYGPHLGRVAGIAGVRRIVRRERGGAEAAPDVVEIREGSARYEVDVARGQKTGFFLDQRDNRRLVGRLAAGADVLNLFGYTGGFSVAAGLGGARRLTTVDQARPAIAAARRNLERNGLAPGELHAEDVFEFLARERGRRWDLVVCDPPSFAPSEKALPGALAAYRRLNRAAAAAVAPGGLFATASCSSHVTEAAFLAAVAAGLGDEGREGRLLHLGGAGPDHPVSPAFPEGRYLKFALLALS